MQGKTHLLNPRLPPPPRNPDRDRLLHHPSPHDHADDIMVLAQLLGRLPLAPVQLRRVDVLQQLRPDVVRQNPLDQAVGLGERVVALRGWEASVVFFLGGKV